RQPVLGVVRQGWSNYTVVEVPGIVLDAHRGRGLGISFLRHLWRVRLVIHLLDGSGQDPVTALREVDAEVGQYDPILLQRPQIVVVNKVDLPSVQEHLPVLRKRLAPYGLARHFISVLTGSGVDDLVTHVHELLEGLPPAPEVRAQEAIMVVSTPRFHQPAVTRDGSVFVVSSPRAERLVQLPDLRQFQVRLQLRTELAKLGVVKALEAAGVQPGDRVRIGVKELRWE
ncbi:Obg family GTPase CgtA, partial [Chloroflexota bacterium]